MSEAIVALRSCMLPTARVAEAGMREPGWPAGRNHPDHLDALGQRGIGQHAHEADRAATVDEAESAARQLGGQRLGRLGVLEPDAGGGAGEDADAFMPCR